MKRKRPWWFGWIPAIVLALLSLATGVTALLLVQGGLGAPAPRPTEGQVTDLNWSVFTPDGLDYVDSTREVRIDLSSPPVAASALGLEPDDSLTIGPKFTGDTVLDYYLIVNGAGESPGGDKFTVSELTVDTENGEVTAVRAPLSEVLGFRPTLQKLLGTADVYGWDTSGVDAIYDLVGAATEAGEGYEFGFGPADRLGFAITGTASCDAGGYCVVEYVMTPAVR